MTDTDRRTEPALTPDEWDGGELAYPTVALSTTRGGDLIVWDGLNTDDSMFVRITNARERHAVAALALYGQPFGFTHEDMDLLLALCLHAPDLDALMFQRADDLANRLAALLPPR